MNEALLIIDVQNDYFKSGKMELKNTEKALENIKIILENFRQEKKEIIFIQHIAVRNDAGFFLKDTEGAKIKKEIEPLDKEKVIIKNYPNSFIKTELESYLKEKKIDTLIITGMMSHMCVDSTTRAAKDLGYNCIVLHDTCATKDFDFNGRAVLAEDIHNSFMSALGYYYAEILKTREYLDKYSQK